MRFASPPVLATSFAVALTSAACANVLGLDEFKDAPVGGAGGLGSGGTGAGGGGGTGLVAPGDPCPSNFTCVPEPPAGFSGPVSFYLGDADEPVPSCVGDFGTEGGSFVTDIDEGSATCSCACGDAQGIQCGDGRACLLGCNLECFISGIYANIPEGSCYATNTSSSGPLNALTVAPLDNGSCATEDGSVIESPLAGRAARACESAPLLQTDCAPQELCAPSPPANDRLCIVSAGDVECPSEVWTEREVVVEGFNDGRMCSECGCGPADSVCGGSVVAYPNASCTGVLTSTTVPVGTCNANVSNRAYLEYVPDPSGTCQPTGGVLSGEVTTFGTTTFCCMPKDG